MVGGITFNSQTQSPRLHYRDASHTAAMWVQAGSEQIAALLIATNNRTTAKNIKQPENYRLLFQAGKPLDTFNRNLSQFIRNTLLVKLAQPKSGSIPCWKITFTKMKLLFNAGGWSVGLHRTN